METSQGQGQGPSRVEGIGGSQGRREGVAELRLGRLGVTEAAPGCGAVHGVRDQGVAQRGPSSLGEPEGSR